MSEIWILVSLLSIARLRYFLVLKIEQFSYLLSLCGPVASFYVVKILSRFELWCFLFFREFNLFRCYSIEVFSLFWQNDYVQSSQQAFYYIQKACEQVFIFYCSPQKQGDQRSDAAFYFLVTFRCPLPFRYRVLNRRLCKTRYWICNVVLSQSSREGISSYSCCITYWKWFLNHLYEEEKLVLLI